MSRVEAAGGPAPSGLDTSVPHIARVYDYWLGGKDNFAADREAAEQVIAAYPGILRDVRAQRAFLANAVGYLASILLGALQQGPLEERLSRLEATLELERRAKIEGPIT